MFKIPKALLNLVKPTYDNGPFTGVTYNATPALEVKGFEEGLRVTIRIGSTNTVVAPTLKVSNLAAKTIVKGNNLPLELGDLRPDYWADFIYDQTLDKWVLMNPAFAVINPAIPLSIGVSQTWQDVTPSRALGTSYTNSTGRAIMIHVAVKTTSPSPDQYTGVNLEIGGITLLGSQTVTRGGQVIGHNSAIVPPGATYAASPTGTPNFLYSWVELKT